MNDTYILRVFTDADGRFGDKASIIIDEGKHISDVERLALTKQAKQCDAVEETVFVNDLANANITIMHPQGELDFAGVPALGAAWLLTRLAGEPLRVIKSKWGDIDVFQDGDLTWVRANLANMPPWNHKKLDSAEAVERITLKETETWEHTMVWAWTDESKGLIRARTFAIDWGIPEAQGNGSGSMMLASMVHKSIEIKHGEGCVIFAKPAPNDCADIGGRVVEDEHTSLIGVA